MGLNKQWSLRILCLCVLLTHTYIAVDGLSTSTTSADTTETTTIDSSNTTDNSNTTDTNSTTPTEDPSNYTTTPDIETSTLTDEPTTAPPKGYAMFSSTDWAIIGVTSGIPVLIFIVSIVLGICRVRHEQNVLKKKMAENMHRGGYDNPGFEN